MLDNGAISALVALIPIIWIFFGMLKLRLPSHKAGAAALFIGVAEALFIWKMPAKHIAQAAAEGAAIALWPILWVIFAAVFAYNISVKSGAMEKMKGMLSGISPDRRIQALILAFAFGGFLEAAAGFGTAVAIPIGILAALGFEPLFAAVLCLAANTVPVAFGAVGIPVITLSKVTGLPIKTVTLYTALQLLPFVLLLPFFLAALVAGSLRGIKGVGAAAMISGLCFGAGQTLAAWLSGPELPALAGAFLSLAATILWVKIFPVRRPLVFQGDSRASLAEKGTISAAEGINAWSPYILIFVFILATRTIPFFSTLNRPPFEFAHLFYTGPGGKPVSFSLLLNPGTIIVASAILGGAAQGLNFSNIMKAASLTARQIGKTIVTVISIVALAKVMGYGGMVSSLAAGLALVSGKFFPFISPLIGALGTFITGSDTSSNVLFGELQKQTALRIGADASWIAAANASGATAGKMISPQSIAIAASALGLPGQESGILRQTMKYSLVFVVLLGILVYAGTI